MKAKTILYISLLCLALLLLALGGWIAKGVQRLVHQTRRPPLRTRYA
jgi:hypothetical protein